MSRFKTTRGTLVALAIAGICSNWFSVSASAQDQIQLAQFPVGPIGTKVTFKNDWPAERLDVTGYLSYPDAPPSKVAVMIILHSSGGLHRVDWEDAARWNRIGIATFVIDGFGSRGHGSVATHKQAYNLYRGASDIESAIQFLAKLPEIDASRIGIMGRSLGGEASVLLSLTAFRERNGVASPPPRLVLALYPGCVHRYADARVSAHRTVMFLAELDEFTPAVQCERYAERMKATGADVEWKTYLDAHHSFDIAVRIHNEPLQENYAKCENEVQAAGQPAIRVDTGHQLRSPGDRDRFYSECRTTGGKIGGGVMQAMSMTYRMEEEVTAHLAER